MVMVAGWGGVQEEKSSAFKASGNLFIAVVGAGVLGLPFAFRQSGLLLGAGFLTFVAAGALYCMLLLVRCKRCGVLHRAGIWPVSLLQSPSAGGPALDCLSRLQLRSRLASANSKRTSSRTSASITRIRSSWRELYCTSFAAPKSADQQQSNTSRLSGATSSQGFEDLTHPL